MKILVLAVLSSLLFVVPCIADVTGDCSNSVATNVFIDNQTPVNYGWVGIQSINTRIEGPDSIRSIHREILKYDALGRILEERITTSDELLGGMIEETHITYTIPPPSSSWVQRLGPGGLYNAQVFTAWAGHDATYSVAVRVTRLEYVPRRIFGFRGRRIIIPAYYRPIEDEVAIIESTFLFNLISTSVTTPLP